MAEEVLRLAPGTLRGLTKKGAIEVVAPKAPERKTTNNLGELKQLLGKDFLGPQEVEATFGAKVASVDVPFDRTELQRAKDLNQRLIYRIDKAPDGSPLTMAKMLQLLEGKFQQANWGKVLYDTTWYKSEDFFTKDVPRSGWALVSNEAMPDSFSKNYLQQTEVLIAYLQDRVFKGASLPTPFQEAIREFTGQRQNLQDLLSKDWQQAAQKLAQLRINQFRQKPVEVLYDLVMYLQSNNERLLPDKVVWTNRRASDGRLVHVGRFDSDGLSVYGWRPDNARGYLGVCLSR